MKKIIAILAVLMLVPFTAFGLEALSEDVLDDVTGQAGVSINLDIEIDATIETAAWGDADGLGSGSVATTGAIVGLENMTIDGLRVRAREDWALSGDPALMAQLRLLTIDVAQDATGALYNGASFVRIGTGTLQISMDMFKATAGLAAGSDATAIDMTTGVLGTIYMDDLEVYLNNSTIDIYSGRNSGVTFTFDISVDLITIATLSWGDLDGLGDLDVADNTVRGALPYTVAADTEAGYIGITGFEIDNLDITGTVTVDVATISSATPTATTVVALYNTYINTLGNPGGISSTYVHLGFDTVNIKMGSMKGSVDMGSTEAIADATLGNFYVDNVDATVNGWVDIFAH